MARKDSIPSEPSPRGRYARRRVPRRRLAEWDPNTRGHDALQTVLAQNAIRVQELLPIRYARMSASPWIYCLGAAAVMAADLASTPGRNLYFDLRDFDETLPGPFEWDLKRLATSLVVLGRENGCGHAAFRSGGRRWGT
ncbi:DUF2252 family protein [Rhodococcus sp. IEGM 1381]|uniref:DUF2252 family protein n=1 Tax=Rhodococcus sp. IEGM 1381 TaxID=3047085 RepID=UPI0024B6E187|nr:DUF2252 family protein [Rhodococcus sp. IEGM 1381]MDI9895317.1 DUF2252 family protein [Rhodococcus sp. IEGM 1381]